MATTEDPLLPTSALPLSDDSAHSLTQYNGHVQREWRVGRELEAFNPAHIELDTLKSHLQQVLEAALRPGGKPSEVDELAEVFRDSFGFTCETYAIPSRKSQAQLSQELYSFDTQYEDNSELLIFYYGGHGENTADDELKLWSAGSSSVRWRLIRDIIGDSTADYLIIMDCCFAASSVRKHTSNQSLLTNGWESLALPGRKELLAACGWEFEAVGGVQSKTSYTARLIEALRGFHKPFSVAQLHTRLATIVAEDPKKLIRTPFYCSLSSDDGHQIMLSPSGVV
ncbi:hypothetical protein LTR85_010312 [Meristemomyces frigidus]|nr:hypothetical protein LTR85_010312 [Meristemomyces frigidus]